MSRMSFFRFLFSKKFLVNLIAASAFGAVLVAGVFWYMDHYTDHGVTFEVPDFRGISIDSLEAAFDTTELNFMIVDSIYSDEIPRGSVAEHDPLPGSMVKRNRVVYITANAWLKQQVQMPDLVNLSLRQAKAKLESSGLRMGELTYTPDIAKNAVLKQFARGVEIEKGTSIVKGATIDLEMGDGLSSSRVPIPYLLYRDLAAATEAIKAASLNVGAVVIDTPITDTAYVKVYRQIPSHNPNRLLRMGSFVDLFLTEDTARIDYDTALLRLDTLTLDSALGIDTSSLKIK